MRIITHRDGSQWDVSEAGGFGVGPAGTTGEAALVFASGSARLIEPVVPGTLAQSSADKLLGYLENALATSGAPKDPIVVWFEARSLSTRMRQWVSEFSVALAPSSLVRRPRSRSRPQAA